MLGILLTDSTRKTTRKRVEVRCGKIPLPSSVGPEVLSVQASTSHSTPVVRYRSNDNAKPVEIALDLLTIIIGW